MNNAIWEIIIDKNLLFMVKFIIFVWLMRIIAPFLGVIEQFANKV